MSVTNVFNQYIIEDSCPSLGLSHRGLVENFRADLSKSMIEGFRGGYVGSQFHADAVFEGITVRFLESMPLDNGIGSAKSEDAVHSPADPEVIEL